MGSLDGRLLGCCDGWIEGCGGSGALGIMVGLRSGGGEGGGERERGVVVSHLRGGAIQRLTARLRSGLPGGPGSRLR